jgi:hypothetical protein
MSKPLFIGLIILTFLTAINLFVIRNYMMGGVYFCYGIANVLLYFQC